MLLSFRFANHRSFRDEQQLNLLPVYGADGADGAPVGRDAVEAVPVAGIFGANASGKSNVISALGYLSDMVGLSDRQSEPGVGPQRQPFLLDPEVAAEPSSYAVDVLVGGVRHTYGFTLDDDQVLDEWLYSYPFHRKRVIFERTRGKFDWGEESGRSGIKRLADITAPTALFLSVSARFESRQPAEGGSDETSASLHGTFSLLWQKISQVGPSTAVGRLAYSRLLGSSERRTAIVELLRAAGIGLQDVFTQSSQDEEDNFLTPIAEGRGHPGLRRRDPVQFLHRGSVGDVTLGFRDESSGTLRLLELASRAISVLDRGAIFLLDEIDSSLHPLLTASLVRLFQSPSVNKNGAQLVFTSHDATLLGSIDGEDVLRRDQVWFTSKGDDGASELFPLSEFKPRRQGENRQKRYLNGSYGAIPELSMRLFEQAVTSRADARAE